MRGAALLAAVAALGQSTDARLERRLHELVAGTNDRFCGAELRLPVHVQRRATRPGRGTPSRRSLRLRGRGRGARRARKAARRG